MGKWDSYNPTRKINISLIYVKILNFDKSGLTPTYKHWGAMLPWATPLPLVLYLARPHNQWRESCPLLTTGWDFACIYPGEEKPNCINGRTVKSFTKSRETVVHKGQPVAGQGGQGSSPEREYSGTQDVRSQKDPRGRVINRETYAGSHHNLGSP